MYMYRSIILQPVFTIEQLDKFWWNSVDVKYTRSFTMVVVFDQIQPLVDSGGDKNWSKRVFFFNKLLLQTAADRMHSNDIEAFGKKCFNFCFHSKSSFITHFDIFWDFVILTKSPAMSLEFLGLSIKFVSVVKNLHLHSYKWIIALV